MTVFRPLPAVLLALTLLGPACVYSRYAAAPPTPDFYTFGPAVEVQWGYSCQLSQCGYPSRWAGNRWVYWTGSYWAYEEGGFVYAWTHVRSRPTGVRYTRPRNVVTVDPYRPSPPYPAPVQRPSPRGYAPSPSPGQPTTYPPPGRGSSPPPPGRRRGSNDSDRDGGSPQRPTPYSPTPSSPPPSPR